VLLPTASEREDHHHPAPDPARRHLLWASVAAALSGAGWTSAQAQGLGLRPTSDDARGPFFPLTLPADQDADLTLVTGQDGRAKGPLLYVGGRVLNRQGAPVADAVIELWQANAAGRYSHPGDDSMAPLDPSFQGYARLRTDADGRWRIKTVKPGAYASRTPHIHFDVRGQRSRLVTQMYFEGEARNETDGLLRRRSPEARQSLIARYAAPSSAQEKDALVAAWDIVLAEG